MKLKRLIPYAFSLMVLILGACQREASSISSADEPAAPSAPSLQTPATPPLSGPGETTVEVTITDRNIEMPATLKAGPQNFSVSNDGEAEHNFEITGVNLDNEFATPLQPGETRSMLVDLKPGTYTVRSGDGGLTLQLTVQ
ncbi:MAG TPA: hypothetical protein VIL97_03350 [Thermoanaerobaculia bacterium]